MTSKINREEVYFNNKCVENRIICFKRKGSGERLVFVPNWHAKEKHWTTFVETLTADYQVEYFESREKINTRIKKDQVGYTVPEMSQDLVRYLNQINGPYHLIGASIGACLIVKGWAAIRNKPKSLVLMCPILDLKMPRYFHLFKFIPERLLKAVRPVIFSFLSSSKQLRAVSKNLYRAFKSPDLTELLIIKASIQDLIKMRMDVAEVQRIKHPSFVVYTLDDGIHLQKDAQKVIRHIHGAKSTAFETFRAVHGKESAEAVLSWVNWQCSKTDDSSAAFGFRSLV